MIVRKFDPTRDRDELARLTALNPQFYPIREDDETLESLWVAENSGRLVGVFLARHTIEAAVMIDPDASHHARWSAITKMSRAAAEPGIEKGFVDAFVACNTDLAPYAKLLARLPGFYFDDRIHIGVDLREFVSSKEAV